jgi:hypothetical protein
MAGLLWIPIVLLVLLVIAIRVFPFKRVIVYEHQ